MNVMQILIIGLTVGVFSGFFGVGGGILLVPILMFILKLPAQTATGTSLAVFLFPVGALGVYEYWRAGKINVDNFKMAALMAVGIFLGAYLGSKIAIVTPEKYARIGFAILLFATGTKLLLSK